MFKPKFRCLTQGLCIRRTELGLVWDLLRQEWENPTESLRLLVESMAVQVGGEIDLQLINPQGAWTIVPLGVCTLNISEGAGGVCPAFARG